MKLAGLMCCARSSSAELGSRASGPPDYHCDEQPAGTFDPITISNKEGTLTATFIRYGATLTHLVYHGHRGSGMVQTPVDVVLGWEDPKQYCAFPVHTYFGAAIGRVANRIANGTFNLRGHQYILPRNENDYDTLHGGWIGWDRKSWNVVDHSASSVTFSLESLDGDEGFPGNVDVTITHKITHDDSWQIFYRAVFDRDTPIALTSHPYFNLNGNVHNTPTVLEHVMHIPNGSSFVEVDSHLIPTGAVKSVQTASYMDFTTPKEVGRDIDRGTVTPQGGYDNAWVIRSGPPPASGELPLAVELYTPLTGIGLRLFTDQPSLQVYSGNFLNGTDPSVRIPRKKSQSFGKDPQYYQYRGAVVLEAQAYPDALNHPNFPSVVVPVGKCYEQRTHYQLFSKHIPPIEII